MIVHGKERLFRLTVGASMAIAEICPDGDLERLSEAITGPYTKVLANACKIILALQAGYEDARAYDDPTYTPDYMTMEELQTLEPGDFKALEFEAIAQYTKDSKPSVETVAKKK